MTTLKSLWVSKGLTITLLAVHSGVSVPTIYRMNKKLPVRRHLVERVIPLLGITYEEYLQLQQG